MKYLKIPEGVTSLTLAFNGEMSKLTDEQREAWAYLNDAAKAALAQQDEEKTMTTPHETEVPAGIERAHKQGGPDGADFKEAMKEYGTKGDPLLRHLAESVAADQGITHSLRYTQDTLAVEFKRIFKEEIMALRNAGQKEYAHEGSSPFANFERGAADAGIDRKSILWIYAMKHRDGIAAAIKGHTSQREDVRGRINDLIVYLLLLRAMYNEEFGDTGNFGLGDLEK